MVLVLLFWPLWAVQYGRHHNLYRTCRDLTTKYKGIVVLRRGRPFSFPSSYPKLRKQVHSRALDYVEAGDTTGVFLF